VKHCLIDVCHLKIYLTKREKGDLPTMFEEFSTSGGQAVVVLFWLFLAMIFVWGLASSRAKPKTG
jgi:hypothetical protein